jgi:L-lactate dehydrogenase
VLGEHGDSQFVAWSLANIGNTPLSTFPEYAALDKERIAADTKNKAYSIIAAKGATHFGIGAVVASLAESILFDTRQVRPVSHYIPELQCCLSLPAVLGKAGVYRTMPCMGLLDAVEQQRLRASASAIRGIHASAKSPVV